MNKKGYFHKTVKGGVHTYKVYDDQGKHIDTLKGGRDYYAITYGLVRNEDTAELEVLQANIKRLRQSFGRPELLQKADLTDVLICTQVIAPPSLEEDLENLQNLIRENAPKNKVAGYIGAVRHELSPDEVQMLMNGVRALQLDGRGDMAVSTVVHDINGILDAPGDSGFTPKLHRFYRDPTGSSRGYWLFMRRPIKIHADEAIPPVTVHEALFKYNMPEEEVVKLLRAEDEGDDSLGGGEAFAEQADQVIVVEHGDPVPAYTLDDMMPEVLESDSFERTLTAKVRGIKHSHDGYPQST